MKNFLKHPAFKYTGLHVQAKAISLGAKFLLCGLVVGATFFGGFSIPVAAQGSQDIVCQWVPSSDCTDASDQTPRNLAVRVTDVLTFLIGAISVVVIIIAGFMYVTSAGSPDRTSRAKNTILYALVGIAVAVFAQLIVRFVVSSL